ncbi:uncharacterized protein CTHT_0018070 [Thermochaetoides thermophila DSM 1495]|uniref:Glycylpeptide N-tetradecanoyltransferase n=1 Tax=Chaetomium thermophilum (strain DSM 1495 / CBS 144.50 / IMI 039719) TaxID=759272 RepID=G0S2Q3_CHATD|nr:hypothetical protein CTHT_0018070 [Thermochaetoides thermophila DSM 1495]EGS22286.1 hypothetical protein CTHT_0018070 [Thermochaetoides thermophila DSM 1495]
MSEESKQIDPAKEVEPPKQPAPESDEESGSDAGETKPAGAGAESAAAGSKKKKKKNKKKSKPAATTAGIANSGDAAAAAVATVAQAAGAIAGAADAKKALEGLTPQQIQEFISLNPALANELLGGDAASGSSQQQAMIEAFKKLKLQDIMTGLASSGKNRKDMASYKFWSTQPVPQFGEEETKIVEEGPLRIQKVEEISTEPIPLALEPFRWVTMDLSDEKQLEEVEKLLYGHYVEDDEAMFRFKYSRGLLRWSLLSPGWRKEWHVGIRSGNTLCAFISAIPTNVRVRNNVIQAPEVNFLCIHKKLRGKRLAPVLIKEITRRINLDNIWQAIYTGGIVLPRPVSTCRYFHRALNWMKLYEVGFSPCPPNSKPEFQARRYKLPTQTSTAGLREVEKKDLEQVQDLLERYLKRFELTPVWTKEEVEHWLLPKRDAPGEQVVWTYVVESPSGKITDFFSFYCLESSVIQSTKYSSIKAAYLFYYATEAGLGQPEDRILLKKRLNELIHDALILAKRHNFDVFNALSLMDNPLFLEQQKFGPGDGQLHYYLFNYRANPIHGGVNKRNQLEDGVSSGVGFVML